MIGIINYGTGNVGSIYNMLRRIGSEAKICTRPDELKSCKKIILPGVGSYDNAVNKLKSTRLFDCIINKVKSGTPFLGICLGMQILGTKSEEGKLTGLNLIPGEVIKFPDYIVQRVPHMGWNTVKFKENPLVKNLNDENKFYFVHRYIFVPDNPAHTAGNSKYGLEFSSFIKKDNIYGVQFHPEKSHKYGMLFLENFKNLD